MEETYIFKYDENISKEFLTKISNHFIITKVIITLNHIIENHSSSYNINISYFSIPIIEDSINYFNNKIEYACIPFLSSDDLDVIDNLLTNNSSEICIYGDVLNEWIECEFIIKETNKKISIEFNYGDENINNNLIFKSNVFNDYAEFKNYFLTYTKITEEQYKKFMIKYWNLIHLDDNDIIIRFVNIFNNRGDDIIIFNDSSENL
jgi:hypothetical protein